MRRARYQIPESVFASIQEAEGWARERWPEMQVDFKGLDLKIVSVSLVRFEYLAHDYPNTAGCIKALLRWKPKMDPRAAGFAKVMGDVSGGVRILFNDYYFKEPERFLAAAMKNVDQCLWPEGAEMADWPLTHEFGHIVLDRLAESGFLLEIKRLAAMRVDRELGLLAREGTGEGFAQAFAALVMSPKDICRGPYAALVRAIITKATAERVL